MARLALERRVETLESEVAEIREDVSGRLARLEVEMSALLWLGKSTFAAVVLGIAGGVGLALVKGWLHLP